MSGPVLSYILATDALGTVGGVFEALARQSCADAVELILVSPAELDPKLEQIPAGLFGTRAIRTPAPLRLAEARARGIHEASAPFVFVGETHSYPEPRMVECLVAALEKGWSAAVPAVLNANPASATSWAGFVLDYGTWNPGRQPGEVDQPLVYNAAYRRQPLLELGDRLGAGLSAVDHDLWKALAAAGHRGGFVPEARIRHLNVVRRAALLRERFYCGVRLGLHRARRWPLARRLAYAAASPLTSIVLAVRARRGIRHYAASRALPVATYGWMAIALAARVAGEAVGYLGIGDERVESTTTELEVHKLRYSREVP